MSPIAYAFTGGLSMSCSLLISPIVTYLLHLFGNRPVLNIGVFLQLVSFIGASFAKLQWHIFLSQGVCFGFAMGCLYIGSVGISPQWFSRKRAVANSICAAGSGLGGLIYALGTNAMLSRFGLGWTFRILGLVTFAVNLIATNLMRDRNKATGSRYRAFHFPLFKRPEFLLLLAWGFLSLLGYVVVLFSLSDFARVIGLSAHQGSIVSAILNLGQAVGRPMVGLASDRFGRINMASLATFLCGVFCLAIWIPSQNMGVLCFFAIIVGTVAGTFWATVVSVFAEVIGLQELPSGLSIAWVFSVPPTTVSEPIAVLLKGKGNGNRAYIFVQIFAGLTYIVASLCLWFVRSWKMGDNDVAEKKAAFTNSTASDNGLENSQTDSRIAGQAIDQEAVSGGPTSAFDDRIWAPSPFFRRMIAKGKV